MDIMKVSSEMEADPETTEAVRAVRKYMEQGADTNNSDFFAEIANALNLARRRRHVTPDHPEAGFNIEKVLEKLNEDPEHAEHARAWWELIKKCEAQDSDFLSELADGLQKRAKEDNQGGPDDSEVVE